MGAGAEGVSSGKDQRTRRAKAIARIEWPDAGCHRRRDRPSDSYALRNVASAIRAGEGARRRHRAARSVIAGVLRRDGRSALAPEVRRQTIAAALRWQSSSDVRARGSRVWVCALARGQCLDRRSRAIRVAAAGDPLTKPKKGPKSLVAEKPVTYRPGRLVPKLVSRTGNPSAVSIRSSSPAR
jgi:hypothetical protein